VAVVCSPLVYTDPVVFCVLLTYSARYDSLLNYYASLSTLGSRGITFSGHPSGCPSGRLSIINYFIWCDICTWWRDFNEICHNYSTCVWELLKKFSSSEVKGQGHICTYVWLL